MQELKNNDTVVAFPTGLLLDPASVSRAVADMNLQGLVTQLGGLDNRPVHIEIHIHNHAAPADKAEKPKSPEKVAAKDREKRNKKRMKLTMFWGKLTMYASKISTFAVGLFF